MGTASIHEGVRRIRFSDLLERTEAKRLTQEAASEVLGISVGTFQRWAERFEAEGDDGLRIGIAADIAQQRLMIDAAAHILIEPGDIGKPHPQHAGNAAQNRASDRWPDRSHRPEPSGNRRAERLVLPFRTRKRLNKSSTTLAECVCATVCQGFAFGNMGTAEAAAEG